MSRWAAAVVLSSMLMWSCVGDNAEDPARPLSEVTANAQISDEGSAAVMIAAGDAGTRASTQPSTQPASDAGTAHLGADAGDVTYEDPGTGLPCDVAALLEARCIGCHGASSKTGVVLLTRDQLLTESTTVAGALIVERALARMHDLARPMPPKGDLVTADEMAPLAAWLADGLPETHCAP